MCILCVIQKWSRRIATMLPWLVIPLIALWALSQLLPPAFRFEITSPRLACVLVLLVTLFWYEILMPQLSAWRFRRNARLRERKRSEAIEMQKLRKTATRRCRNCLTAYRDQNPGAGKFMCSYCGHISKRPVLDLPVPPGMGNPGILKDLVGKGGKILNGKAWSDKGWMCGQDWLENGNWGGGPFAGKSSYWKKNGGGLFGGDDEHCLAETSCSRVFIFVCRTLTTVFLCVVWLWRKIFKVSSSRDDASADADQRGMLVNRGENEVSGPESRGEKARRKAEEKRQARLEKELIEEEERMQREEVAKLVEERRKLRDEKTEAEKDSGKGSPRGKAKDSKKEAERKRQERKKERDKGSSKSNSDVEELEKRAGKGDRRDQHVTATDSMRTHGTEIGHGFKGAHNRGNAGTRYFDRMRGTLLSSSRAITGGGFFGKGANASTVSREHKTSGLVGNSQSSAYRKEIVQPAPDKCANRPVFVEPQPCTAPKKSWQQLFTRSSSSSPPPSNPSVISRPTGDYKAEGQNSTVPRYPTSTQSFDNPINSGLPNPFTLPSLSFGSSSGCTTPPIFSDAMLPKMLNSHHQRLPEELEIFEDPCYVPDPISLLGPVSESLDNFQLNLGFAAGTGLDKPCPVKIKSAPSVVTKPSPIKSPLSQSRVSEERHAGSALPGTPKAQDNSNNANDNGTWQMWNSTPLGQDGLGIVGGPVNSWHSYPEMNLPKKEENIHPAPRKTMASLFKKDEKVVSGSYPSQNVLFSHPQNGGAFNTSLPSNVDDSWLPRTLFGPNLGPEHQILMKHRGEAVQNSLVYGNSSGFAVKQQFELPATESWPKMSPQNNLVALCFLEDWTVQGPRDGVGNSPVSGPHAGGMYTSSDVQSSPW
ncbi:hypothetical protein CASFOL_000572 [Castilleja foliolosa]|uniref:Stress response NST1-like protein n=1 Tax=Castilleja foliolosa TaxID=1961234 RepID=A0ABD3EKK8_9LAMI